jgi:RHS repeat-associated protein
MATGDSPAVRRTSITEHDANGNLRREVRPAGIDATTRLPETDDTGTNLRANLDAASSNARVFSYRADDLLQHERLPWAGAGDEQYVRSRGYEDDADDTGEVKWIALPSELPDGAGDPEPSEQRTSYTHNDAGWITTSTDEARGRPGSEEQRVRYSWNERGQQVQWRSSTVAQTGERDRHALRWAYWPNGLLRRREAVKRVPGSEPGSEQDDADPPKYDYLYNANRSVTRLVDEDADGRQPGDQTRTTVYTRDDAERPTRINERWADGETGSNDSRHADVELTYEPHTGQLASRRTDGRFETSTASDGRQTVSYAGDDRRQTAFTYDSLGRELTMTVDPTAADATDTAANRVTTTRWTDNDLMRRRVKPNGTEDSYAYNALGERTEHTRGPETGADEVQEYVYDANGNRTLDERGQRTAPNDAADLNLRYNARDQLVFWRRPADRGRVSRRGWETTYRLNATGAVQTRTERDPDVEDVAGTPRDESVRVESEFDFDGDRIDSVTTEDWEQAVDGHRIVIRQSHRYDDAGNTQRVFTDASALGSSTPITLGAPAHGAVDDDTCPKSDAVGMEGDGERKAVSRFCFDAFNRQTFSSGYGLEDAQSIEYDGLDRRDRTTTSPQGQPERVRDFTYLGLTELLIREAPATGTATNRYVYDYDSRGDRVGQQSSRDNGYRTYAKDVNGSVVGLESATQGVRGAIDDANRYDFDPYGELDRDETADCDGPDGGTQACSETQKGTSEQTRFGLSQDAEENPFRFEGFYHDSGVRSYDMHARQYRPQSTAFLSRDIYASAAGDWALQADPLTQDRYAFAGGNPVTNVEFDGHEPPTSHNQKAKQHLHNKNGACMGCNDDRKTIQARKRAPAGPDWFGQRRRPNHLKTEFQPEGPLSKRRPANADGGKSQTIDAQLTKKVDIEPLVKTLIGGSPTEILANVFPAGRAANQIRRGGKALRDGLRGSDDAGDAAKGPKVSGGACSFSGQTLVLMGDGTKKPISEIRVGDRVIATDPETGKQSVRTVTRVWVHTDRLATLRLEGEELTTTEDHPFWNVTDQAWQRADALDRGDFLATPDGEYVRFGDLGPDAYRGTAYNLTVAGVHTYHVGRNAVLVHNDCINWGANSVPTFGHTFSDHGAGAKVTRSLVGRAARTGTPQGQWLNNDAAAAFLRSVHVEGAGPRSVRLPAGLGQVVHPDGSIGPAKAVTIIPRRDGVIRSAFPIPGG